MDNIKRIVTCFISSEDGATSVEYAIVLALVGVSVIFGAGFLGETLKTVYNDITMQINGTI